MLSTRAPRDHRIGRLLAPRLTWLFLSLLLVTLALACSGESGQSGNGLQGIDVVDPAEVGILTDSQGDGSGDVSPPETGDAQTQGPKLSVDPDSLDFGWLLLGDEATRWLTIRNDGDVSLLLEAPSLIFELTPYLDLPGAPSGLTELAPGHVLELGVRFHPTALFAPSNDPIAQIRLASNDPLQAEKLLDVMGRVTETPLPDLAVDPEPVVFGLVVEGETVEREVILKNIGLADLLIETVTLAENPNSEFVLEILADGETEPLFVARLEPSEELLLRVAYTNKGSAAANQGKGVLRIASTDADEPSHDVELQATPHAGASCELVVETSLPVDFGALSYGGQRTELLVLRNTGAKNGGLHWARAMDCAKDAASGTSSYCSDELGLSAIFEVLLPPGVIDIPPGQTFALPVRALIPNTPNDADFAGGAEKGARFAMAYGCNDDGPYDLPLDCLPTESCAPNLTLTVSDVALVFTPSSVAFGDVAIGCGGPSKTLKIENTGSSDAQIASIHVAAPCGAEFGVAGVPALPTAIPGGTSIDITVHYDPLNTSVDSCHLVVELSDGVLFSVDLTGQGTVGQPVTDEFHQIPGHKADVLFVVDGSGSMSPMVNQLASDAYALIDALNAEGTDFHLGVIGIGTHDECSTPGVLVGQPRYLDSSSSDDLSARIMNIFDDPCGADAQEAGLEAARLGLSYPTITDKGTSCTSDTDCNEPFACVDSFCGGPNRGFMRADAALHVIVISDEEDQSPLTVGQYVDAFEGIKGPENGALFEWHSIVGPAPGGCSSSLTEAEGGARYIEVSEATGGQVQSICANDYAPLLASAGTVGLAYKTAYQLSEQAEAATLTVVVNGAVCETGWIYDPLVNQVVFDPEGACFPGPGQGFSVSYQTGCL